MYESPIAGSCFGKSSLLISFLGFFLGMSQGNGDLHIFGSTLLMTENPLDTFYGLPYPIIVEVMILLNL